MRSYCLAALGVSFAFITFYPQMTFGQQGVGANETQGLSPLAAYSVGEIDNVNPANGTLYLQLPVVSYPQRGKLLRLNFNIYYNNSNWYIKNWPPPTQSNTPHNAMVWSYAADVYNNGGTSMLGGAYVARDQHLSFGFDQNVIPYSNGSNEYQTAVSATSTFTSNFVREPNGAKHYYSDTEDMQCTSASSLCPSYPPHYYPTIYAGSDGSGYYPRQYDGYSGAATTMLGPDGLTYSINSQNLGTITDPSGNSISASTSWLD